MTNYDSENDVSIFIKKLPGNVRAFSLKKSENKIVVLNDCLSVDDMRKSYHHELLHFQRGDHEDEEYVEYA